MGEARTVVVAIVRVSFLGLLVVHSGSMATEDPRQRLEPCPALATADRDELELERRRQQVLRYDEWPPSERSPALLQLVVKPAFAPEWALAIHAFEDRCRVYLSVAEKNIGFANRTERRGESELRKRAARVAVSRSHRAFPCEVANQIAVGWRSALTRIRLPQPDDPLFVDGVSYTATQWKPSVGKRCGYAHAPPNGSVGAAVRDVGLVLREFVESGVALDRARLNALAERIGTGGTVDGE